MESVCIMCGEKRNGLKVKDDWVINSMRWLKRRVSKNVNKRDLIVCKECFLKYRKRRDSYERKQVVYVAIGVIFLVVISVAAGGRISAILAGFAIAVFMFLLAQLSYMPEVGMPKERQQPHRRKKA
ncbi:MAG: hypothetical protein ACREBH_02390 [Candidatus Micrarchaeaceae archaeon]